MTDREFADRLAARAVRVAIGDELRGKLVDYWRLLSKWNAAINLTALALDPPTDAAIDRLFIEPIAAIPHFPAAARVWYDLGSGGGSPAIPMRLGLRDVSLVMVEARERKATFLKEAVRQLGLSAVQIIADRFETILATQVADVVTVRAVRMDQALAKAALQMLGAGGRLLSFQAAGKPLILEGFASLDEHEVNPLTGSVLRVYVPRGTSADVERS